MTDPIGAVLLAGILAIVVTLALSICERYGWRDPE